MSVDKRKFDIITIGSVMRDIFFYTDEGEIVNNKKELLKQKLLGFELAAKIEPKSSYVGWGGGALNSATSFARLGLKTGTIVSIDKKDKPTFDINLRDEKIKLIDSGRSDKTTGVSFIVVDSKTKEHVIFLSRAANKDLMIPKKLPPTKWIYLSSLTGKNSVKNLETIRKLVLKQKILLAWNPGNEQLALGFKKLLPLLCLTSVLILNKDEAMELVKSGFPKIKKSNLENISWLLQKLLSSGSKVVVVTEGRRGANVAAGGGFIHEKRFDRWPLVETTGAGDAFGSTFVAGLELTKGDLQKSLHWALVNSGSVVSKVGATDGLLRKQFLKII